MVLSSFKEKFRRTHSERRSSKKLENNQAGDGLSKPNLLVTTPQEPPQEPSDLWLVAEQRLKEDENLSKILEAANEILKADFQFQVSSNTSTVCDQLSNFFDTQTRELEEKKWVIKLGEHSIAVQEQLKGTFQNILKLKEVINTATSASPAAAIACAGVMISLQLVAQAVEQHEALLQGLETTSAMLPRLRLMEDLYLRPSAKLTTQLINEFTETLTSIYAKVIEFQARALCYLRKHSVSRLFRDMFKQDGWDDLVQDMQRLEASAESFTSLMESAELRKKLDDIQEALSKDQIWRITSERDEKVKRLFRLLYTCPYRDRKDRNSKRVPGTCEWFTNHSLFWNWEQSNHSSLLWVSADPGCGKSVLTKFLVDDFFFSSHRRRTVCYFFFKDDFNDQKTAANALSAILRQLFMEQPHLLPDSVLEKLDTDGEKLVGSFNDLWNILISVASNPKAGEIICVLDALDECLEVDRKQLTEALTMFYSENFKTQNLKFLLTSRPYDHIRRGFQGLENKVPTIHLSGEGEAEIQQISYEIDLVIKKRVEDISKQNDLRPDECSYLQEQLTSVPNRTYLWVSLTLNVVENMTGFTRGNIRQTIQSLPPNVDEAYGRILDRSPDQVKARRLLHVITAAERPLSLRELSLAMAFSAGYQSISDIRDELETDDKRLKRTIRDLCGLLVVIIDEKVYLLHQTAKEFLVQGSRSTSASANNLSQTNSWKHSLRPEESHEILANACMSYLIQDTTIQTDVFHYFLDYAAYYWPTHFRRAFTQDAHEAAKLGYRLCQTGSNIFRIWSNVFETRTWLPVSSSTILIASYLDLAAIVRLCLDTETADVDSKDSQYNQTPLSWAAEKGHEGVVALLLDTGNVDVNSRDTIRFTPLLWAARGGYEAIVRLLLDTGKVDVNSEDKNAQSPLSWAAGEGHEAVVRLLLDTGEVDIDSRSKLGATPLIWAAGEGHEAVVKLLLDTGKVDINSKDRWGRTALLWAAENGHEGVVALLLETGKVDLDSRTNSGETPLSLAMKEEHKAVVSLLEKSKIASTTTHIPVT